MRDTTSRVFIIVESECVLVDVNEQLCPESELAEGFPQEDRGAVVGNELVEKIN